MISSKTVASDLTVVIPTLGRDLLQESLSRILAGTEWPSEVIVVHQGDNPAVRQRLEAFARSGLRVRYIHSAERGRASGVNCGIRAALTPFVAITDDDCLVSCEWVARMAMELRTDPERIVTGRVDPAGTEPVLAVNTSAQRFTQRRPRLKTDVLCGGNVGMSRSVLQHTGLFDDDSLLAAAEDCEFAYRALRAGVRIEFVPDVIVEHWGWRSEGQRAKQYRAYALSHGGFYGKYLRQRDPFIALRAVRHLARTLLSVAVAWVRSDGERLAAASAHLRYLPIGVARGWRSADPVPRLNGSSNVSPSAQSR